MKSILNCHLVNFALLMKIIFHVYLKKFYTYKEHLYSGELGFKGERREELNEMLLLKNVVLLSRTVLKLGYENFTRLNMN